MISAVRYTKVFSTGFFAVVLASQLIAQPITTGKLPAALDEISGIAMAGTPNVFAWVHNDSGDTSRIFGIDKDGSLITTIYFNGLAGGKGVKDCEDIATGKSFNGDERFIYLADIGDNGAKRAFINIYRLHEPVRIQKILKQHSASILTLRYPDGPRDAETLMIDNTERLLYIVSKREDTVSVYTASLNWQNGDSVVLEKKASLFFPGIRPMKWIVSGDISWDGKQVLLKTLQKVYYWQRNKNEAIWQTLQRAPAELPYQQEPQGEAICFDKNAEGYFTVSEGKQPPVYYYKLPLPQISKP